MVVELLGMVVAVRGGSFFFFLSLRRFELYGVFRIGIIGLHIGRLVHC